jgi:probable LLM family oxidoreductase
MKIGIDSFAAAPTDGRSQAQAIAELLDRICAADAVGLDVFGLGEHHRAEFLDSAPTLLLAAAAARTKTIRLTSAVTVLSVADPVRVFQNFATLDLLSNGRAEMVVGRGSFIEAFPLFGYDMAMYEDLFEEKLGLLLQLRDNEAVTWKGRFRPELTGQKVYPRPVQTKIPIWVGVGGTPESFVRAGKLGLPLMVAIIGGETHRFRPLVDLYRQAGAKAGYGPSELKVGLHSLGYIAGSSEQAANEYYPGYAETFTAIGRERGWPPVTRARFDQANNDTGALLVGSPEQIAEKIARHSSALGGLDGVHIQMDSGLLTHTQQLNSIHLLAQVKRMLD